MNNASTLLSRIAVLGFILTDTNLFLDTHPNSAEALAFYEKYRQMYNDAVAMYQEDYGPLTPSGVDVSEGWTWVSGNWPWEVER